MNTISLSGVLKNLNNLIGKKFNKQEVIECFGNFGEGKSINIDYKEEYIDGYVTEILTFYHIYFDGIIDEFLIYMSENDIIFSVRSILQEINVDNK